VESRAYSIAEACAIAGVRRTTLYKNIRAGKLRAIKIGRRTFFFQDDIRRWLEGMPMIAPRQRPASESASDPSVIVHDSSEVVHTFEPQKK
jgi:excisionase family DNA binding protein